MSKEIIQTSNAPEPIGPYNQAIKVKGTLYVSGQIALNPVTNKMVVHDIEQETHQVMQNLEAVLKAAKMDFSHVVKSTIFISDMNDFGKINAVYGSYFSGEFPARETVQVARLPKDVHVEISVIAVE